MEKVPLDYDPNHKGDRLVFTKSGKIKKEKILLRSDSLLKKIILYSALMLLTITLLHLFILRGFVVPSDSMYPTINEGDRLLVEKWNSTFGNEPKRGEIVVFVTPDGWYNSAADPKLKINPEGFFVKRIIGIPGDKIECCDDAGFIRVNGVPISEPYLVAGMKPSAEKFKVTVPEDSYWVMGDNRSNSLDSRAYVKTKYKGFVPQKNIVGRVFAIIWPQPDFKFNP